MRKFRKIMALIMAFILACSAMSVSASAASLDTGAVLDMMPQSVSGLSKKVMDDIFVLVNKLAGMEETWTEGTDGTSKLNQTYGERECQKYDLYLPKNVDKSRPQGVILFIHGGQWYMGSKENFTCAAWRYAKNGFITVTMDYDLASQGSKNYSKATGSKEDATVFDMVEDVRLCVDAVDKQLRGMGITPYGLAVSGESAGSHIDMMYAYGYADESAIPVKMIMNLTSPVSFKNGAFDNYTPDEVAGYANDITGWSLTGNDITNPSPEVEKKLDSISPVTMINETSVPTLMGFAGKDTTIGTNQYQTIKPVLDKYGVPNDVVWWPNSNHALYSDSGVLDNEWTPKTLEWLNRYLVPAK